MKKLIYILPILFFSCTTESTDKITETNNSIQRVEEVIINKQDIKADSKIELEIEGMTCEMGCVSTIRNRVTRMKGSTKFDMDFDKERGTDFATVSFDSRLLSSDDIKTEIESIAQGLYSVKHIKVLDLD